MIIAIDGPAATGKSTTAKALAKRLGFTYLDTGAMYRAITLLILRKKVQIGENFALISLLKKFDLKIQQHEKQILVILNGEDVSNEIRRLDVTKYVSEVSALPAVRKSLVKIQRKIAKDQNCVVEGRDIGTIVFPDAEVKFYVVADYDVRAKRRLLDFKKLGEEKSIDELIEELKNRDKYDSEREHSPLLKANDAIEVDTTNLTIEEQVNFMFKKVKLIKG
ncbi:MAG: (d)CMP kinase [Candidatus Neomarinimicrobiota bacterium]|nr:(d)CMP kinase [Candidatus Neomarinimicrobiota bacterium]